MCLEEQMQFQRVNTVITQTLFYTLFSKPVMEGAEASRHWYGEYIYL